MRPRPQIKLTLSAGMGEGKEGGGVTVCEDDDDGAVMCVSEDGTTVRWGVTTNSHDEDRNRRGEGTVVCTISSRFFAFRSFVISPGVLVVPGIFSGLPSCLRGLYFSSVLSLFLVVPFLFSENADTLSF